MLKSLWPLISHNYSVGFFSSFLQNPQFPWHFDVFFILSLLGKRFAFLSINKPAKEKVKQKRVRAPGEYGASITNFIVQKGTPLPNNGTCRHYRKSYRWLRYVLILLPNHTNIVFTGKAHLHFLVCTDGASRFLGRYLNLLAWHHY